MIIPLVAKLGIVAGCAAAAAGVTYVVTEPDAHAAPGARAFVDAPLDGSQLRPGPVVVTAHATSPHGITEVELRVDGEAVARQSTDGERLVSAELDWDAEVGDHELAVTGRDRAGAVTESDVVTVTVGDVAATGGTSTTTGATTTSSSSPSSSTSTPTSTSGPPGAATTIAPPPVTSPPATPPPTPVPTAPPTTPPTSPPPTTCVIGTPRAGASIPGDLRTPPTVRWSYSGCEPADFRIEMGRDAGLARVEHSGTAAPDATSYQPADALACGTWYWRVGARTARASFNWSGIASVGVAC